MDKVGCIQLAGICNNILYDFNSIKYKKIKSTKNVNKIRNQVELIITFSLFKYLIFQNLNITMISWPNFLFLIIRCLDPHDKRFNRWSPWFETSNL